MSTTSPTATRTPTPSPTVTPSPTPDPIQNPWGTETVYVGVDDSNISTGRDILPLVNETLQYWNEHAVEYGDYAVRFVLRPDAELPHIMVNFQEEMVCDGTETIGCAPVLETPDSVDDRPQEVAIKTGYVNETTRDILIHEFGHILGIEHGEPPEQYMQATTETTAQSAPDADERLFPWRNRTLTVYVDEESLRVGGSSSIRDHKITEGLQFYATDRDDGWVDDVSFERIDDKDEADIRIRASAHPPCDAGSCGSVYGHDTDDDGALEYFTHTEITVYTGTEDQHFSWHTAFWAGIALGAETSEDLPDDLRDGKRSGRWWTEE